RRARVDHGAADQEPGHARRRAHAPGSAPAMGAQSMSDVAGKTVVLAVTGSIAAYKVVELARRLTQQGAAVEVVMTQSAQEFVTPLTFQALTYRPVITNMFGLEENAAGHVALGERADVVVVAPATAHTIAKLAHGEADDVIGTTVLATRAPVIVAPAMNRYMYANLATQDNLAVLRRRGVHVVDPEEGALASGAVGPGRLAPIERIEAAIRDVLARSESLEGRHVVVTAGPTHEAIDPGGGAAPARQEARPRGGQRRRRRLRRRSDRDRDRLAGRCRTNGSDVED